MVGTKEMVEDTVGKTTGQMIEADGKAISTAMHPLGTRNGRRIMPTADRMLETGDRLSMAAAITTVLAPGRALGTLGNDLEGTHGPPANRVREEKEKGKQKLYPPFVNGGGHCHRSRPCDWMTLQPH